MNGFEGWAPDSVISNNVANDNDGGGFAIGGQNSILIGNKAYNNGRGRHGYAGFNARINPTRGASASHSIFIGNSSYDQDYGYREPTSGLSDIKQIGNDYNRNRIGPAKFFSARGQMPISPEMKSKVKRSPKIQNCRRNPAVPCANASHGKETATRSAPSHPGS